MYLLKLMNSQFHIYQQIPCTDIDTAQKISRDLDARIYVITKLIFVKQELVRELPVIICDLSK